MAKEAKESISLWFELSVNKLWVTGRKTEQEKVLCVGELQIRIGITIFCPGLHSQENTNSLDEEEWWKKREEGKVEILASSNHYRLMTQHFCAYVKTSNEPRFTTTHKWTICRPPSESVWVRLGLDSVVRLICALWKQNSSGLLHGSPFRLTNPEVHRTYSCSSSRSSPLG